MNNLEHNNRANMNPLGYTSHLACNNRENMNRLECKDSFQKACNHIRDYTHV